MSIKKGPPPPPPKRKLASVLSFRNFLRIHSWAIYGAGVLDPDGIDADHPADLTDTELGRTAREALLASRFIAPDHPDWDRVQSFGLLPKEDEIEARLRARAGVKTNATLYRNSGQIDLELKDGQIRVRTWRHEGRGSFGPIPGHEPTTLPLDVSDEELGAAIREGIKISRGRGKT